jgi:hypothetical protein
MKNERGQAIVITVIFLVVLMGCAALTLDVGMWYRQQRQAQATADAAALAGAQDLPGDPTSAVSSAQTYADKNGGGVGAGDINVSSDYLTDDTVHVKVARQAPSVFAAVLGFGPVTVRAKAAARTGVAGEVWGVAPIVVNKLHPMLAGPNCPCFDQETTIPLGKDGAPGAFGMVDLANGQNGSPNLADWVLNGFPGFLDLGLYDSDPGAKFNPNGVGTALQARVGTELIFPVFDTLTGTGSGAQYDVIGWVAFHLDCIGLTVGDVDCVNTHGNENSITGYFTKVIWKGIQSQSGSGQTVPDLGVYSVSLVN